MIFDILFLIIIIFMIIKYNNFKLDKFSGNLFKTTNNDDSNYLSQKINPTMEEQMDYTQNYYETAQNPNYNTLNDMPFLIDPQNPNKGYYYNKIKIETNPNSELLQKEKKNAERIDDLISQPFEEKSIGGYNKYVNLSMGSPANITSIGKSLLSPYISYPVGTAGHN
jgi:hypothetical protein